MMQSQKMNKLKLPLNKSRSSLNTASEAEHSARHRCSASPRTTKNTEKKRSNVVDFSKALDSDGAKGQSEEASLKKELFVDD